MTSKQRADHKASLEYEHGQEHRKVVEYGRLKRRAEARVEQIEEELRRLEARDA